MLRRLHSRTATRGDMDSVRAQRAKTPRIREVGLDRRHDEAAGHLGPHHPRNEAAGVFAEVSGVTGRERRAELLQR